jgi:hypothetical protein
LPLIELRFGDPCGGIAIVQNWEGQSSTYESQDPRALTSNAANVAELAQRYESLLAAWARLPGEEVEVDYDLQNNAIRVYTRLSIERIPSGHSGRMVLLTLASTRGSVHDATQCTGTRYNQSDRVRYIQSIPFRLCTETILVSDPPPPNWDDVIDITPTNDPCKPCPSPQAFI